MLTTTIRFQDLACGDLNFHYKCMVVLQKIDIKKSGSPIRIEHMDPVTLSLVESLTSEAIPSATQFLKWAHKISHPTQL